MSRAILVWLTAMGLLLSGCGSGTTAASKSASAEPSAIEGKWYGKFELPSGKEEAERELAALYRNSVVELDLKPGGRFTFDMMGTPIEGAYKVEGEKITLHYETIMGKSVGDPQSPVGFLGDAFLDPEVGTIREQGKAIHFPGRTGDSSDAAMTFTRSRPASPSPGPKSVRAEEEAFVGTYVVDPRYELPKPESKAMEKAQEMLKNMMKGFRLELRPDNTFDLTMMLMMKGKWSMEGKELKLQVTEPEITATAGGAPTIIRARPTEKPGQLLMLNDKTGRVDVALKREPNAQ